jgi:adenylosuccinate synthase
MEHMPYDLDALKVTPVYSDMSGWNCDLTGLREDQEIPEALNEYIHFIESQLETPIRCVSVGPDRTQTIERGLLV